jgi:tetratricopeptide (TPR) repeat protein
MLETVHEYAREKLQQIGEREAFAGAHAHYFMKLAEEAEPHLRGAKQSEWFHRLEDEHDNIQAALNWARQSKGNERNRESEQIEPVEIGLRIAGAISRFWYVRGNFSKGREHLEALLSIVTQHGSLALRTNSRQSVANALNALGSLAYSQGDYIPARARNEEALSIGRELGNRQIIASSLNGLGNVAIEQCDYAVARSLYEESLVLKKQLDDRWGISISLLNLGAIAHVQGDYQRARSLYEESLVVARQSEDKSGIAIIVGNLGTIAAIHGDYPRARALQEESLLLRRELGDKSGIATALKELGNVALQEADYAAARYLYEESLAIERALGEVRSVAKSLGKLGNIAFMERDYAQMMVLYRQCLVMFKKLGDKDNIAWCIAELGAVAAVTGHAEQGARMMAAAEVLFQLTGGVMHLSDRFPDERGMAAAQAQLGAAGFEDRSQEGTAMTMAQAIDYALQEA